MPERWLPVTGYEGLYEVSDLGRVRSLDRIGGRGRRYHGRMLRPGLTKGYPVVALCKGGVVRMFQVHTLVLLAFVGPPPDGTECCHNDGSRSNNQLPNLRWDTRSENALDRERHGTTAWGSRLPQAKLTEADIPAIRRRLAAGESIPSVAKSYPFVTTSAIEQISAGRTWKHVPVEEA